MTHEEAIREWIARQIRGRGHTDVTRDHITNVRYATDVGYGGSDVTPGDSPAAALVCDFHAPGRLEHEHAEDLEFITPADLVRACLAIMGEPGGKL